MRKYAVFVEGQAELILIREFVLRMYDYQNVAIDCYILQNSQCNVTDYSFGDKSRDEYYYLIINVGNDNKVLSQILDRAERLSDNGYTKIIGVRDVYGQVYRKFNKGQRSINFELIQKFKDSAQNEINRSNSAENIKLFFAVMEVEAWLLGFNNIFISKNPQLTSDYIESKLGFNLETIDPEVTFYHPAKIIGDIYSLVGETYGKHQSEVSSLVASITKDRYIELIESTKCGSFTQFAKELLH